ncbi:MAG: cysteine desulfurase family protein [Candidatus Gracilibacteria bacterium]|jgi:cysteine desulfurase
MTKQKTIYLDYAATTPTDKKVLSTMLPFLSENFGNPNSLHTIGIKAKKAIDVARETIAKYLNTSENEIIFTSGGTEPNNIAILGYLSKFSNQQNHIITSQIEHSSVLEIFKYLEKQRGFKVTYLKPNSDGFITPENFKSAITKDTIFTSIMYANNEIGTINDITKIAEICNKNKIVFHTDACQAAAYLTLDTKKLNIDLLTFNGSKIYGPKGIGALFIKKGTPLSPIFFGGGQEKKLRSGTLNVAGIVGLAEALKITQDMKEKESKRLIILRDYLIKSLTKNPKISLIGSSQNRLPNNVNVKIKNSFGREFLLQLDTLGICVSSGSACSESKEEISHVLAALDIKETNLRITLGRFTTKEEIDYLISSMQKIIK